MCSVSGVRDDRARRAHPLECASRERRHLCAVDGDRPDIAQGEIVTGERMCHGHRRHRRSVEKPKLEHARRIEAVDPEHRPRCCCGGARRHQADELRAEDRGAPSLCLRGNPLNDVV